MSIQLSVRICNLRCIRLLEHVLTPTDGSDFMGERLIVQFARGSRRNENFTPHERVPPRPRRTPYRMRITNLPVETSWQVRYPNSWISPVSTKAQAYQVLERLWLCLCVLHMPPNRMDSA